jgi:hypothetical protein
MWVQVKEKNELRRMSIVVGVVVLAATWAMPGYAGEPGQVIPKRENKQALRADHVRQLLVLMDTDKGGMISRQEWIGYLAAEFDRLDKARSGMLDIRAVAPAASHARPFAAVGK